MRIVKQRAVTAGTGRLRAGGEDGKEYLDRIAKYIPAEIIAAYVAALGFAKLAPNPAILSTVIFFVMWICAPVYITRFTSTPKETWVNGAMSVIAFAIWAYAMGDGFFNYLGWYNAPTASVILVLFTIVSGAIVPIVIKQPSRPELIDPKKKQAIN